MYEVRKQTQLCARSRPRVGKKSAGLGRQEWAVAGACQAARKEGRWGKSLES